MVRVAEKLYYILILSFILPSGNLFGIPIKLLLCGAIVLATIFSGERIKFDKITWLMAVVFSSLILWAIIASANGYSDTIFQCFSMYLSMLIVIWLTYLFIANKVIKIHSAFKCFQIVAIALIVFKFICEVIFLSNVLSLNEILNLYYRIFNTPMTSLYMKIGGIPLYRVMITNDALPLLFWSFYLIMNKKFVRKLLLTIFIALFCLISYSRVLLAQFVLCLLAVGIIKLKNADFDKRRSKQAWTCIFGGGILVIGALFLIASSNFGQHLISAMYTRFLGSDAVYSDSIRTIQRGYLTQGFLQSPLLGNGTGAFVQEYIRSQTTKFSYELEYLSFLYQFGIIGFFLIIGTTFYIVWRICFGTARNADVKIIVLFNVAVWAIKPIFNPAFLSSNSGIVISMIVICAMYCQQNNVAVKKKSEKRALNVGVSSGARITAEQALKQVPNKSIAKNSIFYLIYTVLNVLFPFVTGIYVTRVLFSDSIGQVAYAQNIAQYFVIFAFLGLPTYGLREISKARGNKEELNKIHSELFFLNLISTAFFSAIYLILIFTVGAFRENIVLYLIVGLSIAFNALNNSWLYEGLEEFKTITIRNLVFKAAAFILLVALVRHSSDVYYYALVTVVGVVGNNIFNIIYSRKFVKFRVKGLNLLRHLKPVLLLVVVNLAIEIYTLIDTTMLGFFCDEKTVAFYTYGNKINKIILQIINTFTIVVVPRLSLYYKEGKSAEFSALLTSTLKVILILAIPFIVGIQFVSEFLITKMYTSEYLSSAYVLRILSAVLLFAPIGYLLGSRVLLAAGKEWKMALSVGVGAVVNVIGNYFLIQLYSEYGAAIASAVSEIVVMIVYVCMSAKYFKLNSFWDTLWRVVLASAAMGGYLFGCSYIPLGGWAVFCIQFFGAVALYFGLLLLMKEKSLLQGIDKLKAKFPKNKAKV